ncbi:hypothetical protein [Clostridium oryzae]|uniref:ABC-2 family transporter protein n=1 Tax=Clostridium oryzae TaxID=1450648 RepID=A0A1V4IQG5_9CLOT|nr:hypothetical protein [Clostridium oryzae]OPJ62268.1 hypothetical protein CLORY_18830 [Clostridium oryzae]
MNKKLCSDLKKALNVSPICSDKHIKETISMVSYKYKSYKRKERIGYLEFLLRQIQFVGRKIWLCQGIVLFFMCWLINVVFGDDFEYIVTRHIPEFLCLYAVIITMAVIPFLERSQQHRMYEVELATRMSISRLICSKLIIIAVGDFVFLFAVAFIVVNRMSISVPFTILYLLLPLLMSSCGCIFILSRQKQHSVFNSEVFCVFLLLLQIKVFTLMPNAYSETALIALSIFVFVFAITLVIQIWRLINRTTAIRLEVV